MVWCAEILGVGGGDRREGKVKGVVGASIVS